MGLAPSKVATIVGLSPGRISQLASEHSEKISVLKEACSEKEIKEGKIEAAKNVLLDHIIAEAGTGSYSLTELARTYEMLSRAETQQQRNIIPIEGTMIPGNVTNISLPLFVIPNISITHENEVVAIEDRSLSPLPSAQVRNLFEEIRHDTRRISAVAEKSA
jgi:hypothetical protein